MHEISLCESVLRLIEEQARARRFARVKAVCLEVGALACVEVPALRFGFELVMKDSIADGARLQIVTVPGQAWCERCDKNVPMAQRFDACPHCGDYGLRPVAGEELRVKELEVE